MRYTLIRYAGDCTKWNIVFALRATEGTRYLIVGKGNSPLIPFTFSKPVDAINWVREHAQPGSSVEWDGSVF